MISRPTAVPCLLRPASKGGRLELRSPMVGLWREQPVLGSVVRPGDSVGRIEVLGVLTPIVAPPGAFGAVVSPSGQKRGESASSRRPTAYDDLLVVLDQSSEAAGVGGEALAVEDAATTASDLVFRAPSSGRFYSRPSPTKKAFISVGDVITVGTTVAVLEVMKTFNRVQYGGGGLPDEARVVEILPADGDDLEQGDPMVRFELVGATS